MKKKITELNVDFIGGQEPLTKEDKKTINEYIKTLHKLKSKKMKIAKKGVVNATT